MTKTDMNFKRCPEWSSSVTEEMRRCALRFWMALFCVGAVALKRRCGAVLEFSDGSAQSGAQSVCCSVTERCGAVLGASGRRYPVWAP